MSLLPRRRSLRATMAGVTMAGLVLTMAGCSRQVDGQPTTVGAGASAPVAWEPCQLNAPATIELPDGTECGLLAVPVNYDEPDGDSLDLAMIRFPATGEKIGSLVFNPGGPGESGIEAAFGLLPTIPPEIREHFDFVGFDPRGVASSSPALWCNSDADNDRQRAEPVIEYTQEGVDYLNEQTQEYVQRCIDKMGVDFLAGVGTDNVARDLDRIRQAVGDEKLTFLGYSYGTRIGTTYAEMYPQNVRAMILDGAIDPNADPVEADIAQAAAFQSAFDDFAADCATSPDCPLGTDPTKAVEVYRDLLDPWQQTPAPTADPRGLSHYDATTATIMALYSPTLWRHLTQGLAELREGRGDTLLILSDLYMRRDGNGHYTNATDVRMAVNCMDEQRVTDMATLVEEDRRLREAAPFLATGEFTGLVPEPTCNKWPVPPTSEPHELSVPDLPATLVVSITGDPATPYEAGVKLADQLGGGLVTFKGTQHTVVFRGNSCVDDYAVKYLIDGTVPGPDTEC